MDISGADDVSIRKSNRHDDVKPIRDPPLTIEKKRRQRTTSFALFYSIEKTYSTSVCCSGNFITSNMRNATKKRSRHHSALNSPPYVFIISNITVRLLKMRLYK